MATDPSTERLATAFEKVEALLGDGGSQEDLEARFQRAQEHVYGKYQFAILNAIPHEFAAIQKLFGDLTKVPVNRGGRSSYDAAVLRKQNGRDLNVIVAGVAGQGITQTAAAIGALAQRLPYIDTILLIGIAAGQPNLRSSERDVWLGDIVVSDRIVQYDHIKRENGKDICRGDNLTTPSPDLLAMARRMKAEMEGAGSEEAWSWEPEIARGASLINDADRPPAEEDPNLEKRKYEYPDRHRRANNRPHLHIGTIGSANILLKDAAFRDQINDTHKTLAYEMEGAGIAIAAPQFNAQYIVVRGICDYADDGKNDDWQRYASVSAAAFGKVLLEQL